jgi:hypothetical protein
MSDKFRRKNDLERRVRRWCLAQPASCAYRSPSSWPPSTVTRRSNCHSDLRQGPSSAKSDPPARTTTFGASSFADLERLQPGCPLYTPTRSSIPHAAFVLKPFLLVPVLFPDGRRSTGPPAQRGGVAYAPVAVSYAVSPVLAKPQREYIDPPPGQAYEAKIGTLP